MDERDIIRTLQGQGYPRVAIAKLKPNEKIAKHKNVVDVRFYVLHGKLEVKMEGVKYIVKLDDDVDIPKDVDHEVHAGPDGATFFVAERR